MHAQTSLGARSTNGLPCLRVIGAINILACHNFPLHVKPAVHLQFCNSMPAPALCNIGYCRAGHDSEFLSTLVGGKLVHLQIHSSGLGEHQHAQAGNLIWTTRAMCALWTHLSNGTDGTNGTGGIVNICGAHLPVEAFCLQEPSHQWAHCV